MCKQHTYRLTALRYEWGIGGRGGELFGTGAGGKKLKIYGCGNGAQSCPKRARERGVKRAQGRMEERNQAQTIAAVSLQSCPRHNWKLQ